ELAHAIAYALSRTRAVPLLPRGERGVIALQRLIVQIEYTGIATAAAAVVGGGTNGRLGRRIVLHGRRVLASRPASPITHRRIHLRPHPRPTNGILLAMIVMNCTFADSGKSAICSTASATCSTSISGSTATCPFACGTPLAMRAAISVAALPMSICP